MHRLQTEKKHTHTHILFTHLSVWVCWLWVSDRVRGISLITWDEEVEREGQQHVKDGPPLSWSSPTRPILLFPKLLPIKRCWCGISAQISHSHRFHYREKQQNRKEPRDRISRIPQKSFSNAVFIELQRSFQLCVVVLNIAASVGILQMRKTNECM